MRGELTHAQPFKASNCTLIQTTLAVLGIVGNTIASVIISRKEMRNAFNLLLVSLACFDSTYLFGSILESIRLVANSSLEVERPFQ